MNISQKATEALKGEHWVELSFYSQKLSASNLLVLTAEAVEHVEGMDYDHLYVDFVYMDIEEGNIDFATLRDVSLAAATKVAISMIEMLK